MKTFEQSYYIIYIVITTMCKTIPEKFLIYNYYYFHQCTYKKEL